MPDEIVVWDGTSLSTVDVGYTLPPASDVNAVPKGTLTVNVMDYGAVGDGAADDTAAVQAAHDALPAGGGEVYFPPGQYKIATASGGTGVAVTKPSVRFRGVGWDQATLTAGSRIVAGAAMTDLVKAASTATTFRMSEMWLDGNGQATNCLTTDGLNTQLRECYFRRPASNGTHVSATANAVSLWALNCRMNGANQAGVTGMVVNATDAIVIGCKPVNVVHGVVLQNGASGALLEGNHITPGSTIGVNCVWVSAACSNVAMTGNRFDNHGLGSAIQVTPSADYTGLAVTGNVFYQNVVTNDTFAAIGIDTTTFGVYEVNITGNIVRSASGHRYASLLAAQTQAGTVVTGAGAARVGSYGAVVSGNSVYAAAMFSSGVTPMISSGNVLSTDGTTWARQGDTVPLAGGTMTGPLVLSADPSAALGAATKQYVDAHSGGGGGGSATTWVNVKSSPYSAAGNGTTDDTAAIASAKAAAVSAKAPLYFPAGTYRVSSTLDWRNPGLQVVTDGVENVKILMVSSNLPILKLAGEAQRISGLTLAYSTLQTTAQTASNGIELGDDTIGSCFESTFEDIYVQQARAGVAISPAVTTVAGLFSCNFVNLHVLGYSHSAIYLIGSNGAGTANCTGCSFTNTYVHNNFTGTNAGSAWWPVFLQDWDEVVFNQLNVEHAQITQSEALGLVRVGSAVVNALHLEDLEVAGNPGWGLVYVSGATTAIINGLSIRFPTMTGTSYNSVVRMFGTGPKCLVNGLNEPSVSGIAASHPLVNFNSATNAQMALNGVAARQTTVDSVNAGSGCSVQVGPWADLASAQTLSNKTFKDSAETLAANATATGSVTVDLSQGNVQALTLTGNITSLAFSNVPAAGAVSLSLYLKQDSTGGRAVAWPGSVSWLGGVAPTVDLTPAHTTLVVLTTLDGGTTWYGSAAAGAPSLPLAIASGGTGSSVRSFAGLLTPTAVKTGAYTAQPGDLAVCDTTSAGFTVTLIAAPADLTVAGVKYAKGTHAVTVATSGTDKFNDDGTTSRTLASLGQGLAAQYSASAGVWYLLGDDPGSGGGGVSLDTTTGDIAASPGTAAAGAVGLAADSGHVHPQPAMFAPTGLTGAVTASRFVGGTASGAPASGTFAVGDFVVTNGGHVYVCTAAGSPGEWSLLGGSEGYGLSPKSLGLAIATCGPAQPLSGVAMTSQKFYAFLCTATVTKTITTLGIYQTVAGVTAVGGSVNGLAIYAAAGGSPLATTGDMTSAFAAAVSGFQATEGTLGSSQRVIAGTNYWLAVLTAYSGTVPQAATCTASGNRGAVNGTFVAQTISGQTSFPSLTPSSGQNQAQLFFIYGR
jgi:hypothetical protein